MLSQDLRFSVLSMLMLMYPMMIAAIPAMIAVATEVPLWLMYPEPCRCRAGTSTPSVPNTFTAPLGSEGLKPGFCPSVFTARTEMTSGRYAGNSSVMPPPKFDAAAKIKTFLFRFASALLMALLTMRSSS